MTGFSDFPLAAGIRSVIEPQIPGLVDGTGAEILEQVTPTTAELLKFWFQQDYCDTRFQNFHAGQRLAVLSIIYAH